MINSSRIALIRVLGKEGNLDYWYFMSQQSSQYSFALFLFQYLKSNSPNCLPQISFHFRPEKLAATNINPLVGIFFLNSHHLSPWKVSILLRENTFRSLLRVEGFNNRTELRKKSLFVTLKITYVQLFNHKMLPTWVSKPRG